MDESGTPAKPGRDEPAYFVFGGIVVPEEQWRGLRQKFIGLKRRSGYRGEVKWRYFAPGNTQDQNPMRDWEQDRRDDFRAEILKIISSSRSVRLICGVCQCSLAYGSGVCRTQEDIYFGTYKVVTERFQYLLQDISRESGRFTSGIIVSDHRNSHEDSRMREQHERLLRESNAFASTYEHFVESIFLSPSHMSIGIQLADIVAGAVWRFHEHNDARFIDPLRSSFRNSPAGKIDGYGLARFPKRGWSGPTMD
ncbi:MAG: DUF3800 domain-containing protein [Pseudomonadota bacterium]